MRAEGAPRLRYRRNLAAVGRCETGAAILEFALALPILFALLGGTFELGRALLVREIMIEAVRGGARYLARVPDPTCQALCTAGAERAVGMTLDQIVENSGLPRARVNVSSSGDPGSDTVAMKADLRLDVELLRIFGLGTMMKLEAVHEERRIGQ